MVMSNINSVFCAAANALHEFWNGFGIPAFVQNYVPKGIKKPYITYTISSCQIFGKSSEKAVIYTFSEDFTIINDLIAQITRAFPAEGVMIKLPNGFGYIRLGRTRQFTEAEPNSDNLSKDRIFYYTLSCYTDESG